MHAGDEGRGIRAAVREVTPCRLFVLSEILRAVGLPDPARNILRKMVEEGCPVRLCLHALQQERGIRLKGEIRHGNLDNRQCRLVHKSKDQQLRTLEWGCSAANGQVRMA